ncbi:MAG: hypothetical protein WCQ99_03700 [Pseudomonadota bacterium]
METMDTKRNAFEALCENRYCWKLHCTTCGNGQLRHDLYRIILGSHPDEPGWQNSSDTPSSLVQSDGREQFIHCPRKLTLDDQIKLLSIVSGVALRNLNMEEPRWLGYLGVVLHWCEEGERQSRLLTRALLPQFMELMDRTRDISEKELLTWSGLEKFEWMLRDARVIKRSVPW